MAIHSTFLGSMKVSGKEAKSFLQKLSHARGTKAASKSANSGRELVNVFAQNGVVTVRLSPQKAPRNTRVGTKKAAK